ncbi:MAG TPA: HlyD family secretion protein [Gammaproteobacteria bacterium]
MPEEIVKAEPAEAPRRRPRVLRAVLLLLGPVLVLAVGGYVYYTGGRYVETDNAYVKADIAVISADVSGPIVRVEVHENQPVAAGDVLFAIDDRPYRVALEQADAQLRAVTAMIESLKAQYRQRVEELELARTDYEFAERELSRAVALAADDLASDEAVDRARHELDSAARRMEIVQRGLEQLLAQLGGSPEGDIAQQASYQAVKAIRDAAALDLERTVVRAPFDGIASKVPVVGRYVVPGAAVMSVVASEHVWIEANYKETELTYVCPGQPVEIRVDTYPDRVWHGRVESISQATGAEFSVIPAQNATGNWVKVIQRIPVRIAVEHAEEGPPLRTGMSTTVEIDTGHERQLPRFIRFGNEAVADSLDASDACNG